MSPDAHISVMNLGAGGEIGFHQAVIPQLFVVLNGEGWVCDESQAEIPISPGQAAFWEKGEWHGAGSRAGMTALVIESESIEILSS